MCIKKHGELASSSVLYDLLQRRGAAICGDPGFPLRKWNRTLRSLYTAKKTESGGLFHDPISPIVKIKQGVALFLFFSANS